MPDIKQHSATAVVAATVAALAGQALPAKPPIIQHVTVAASKYAWPDMTDAEKAELADRLKWFAGKSVRIFCDGADCRDLQTDLDDAFEDAGASSERAIPVNALGYGFAVMYGVGDYGIASRLAADIRIATGGRIAPTVESAISLAEGVALAIGKRGREAKCPPLCDLGNGRNGN
jgi:hypothetical protein